MTTPTDYTARAEAYVATCPSPAIAYAVIRGLMLDYNIQDAVNAACVTVDDATDYLAGMADHMRRDGGKFTEAAQEALRSALKRRVEA